MNRETGHLSWLKNTEAVINLPEFQKIKQGLIEYFRIAICG